MKSKATQKITEKMIEDFAELLKKDLKDKFKTEMHLKSTEFNEILKDILKHPYKKETDIYILNTYLKSLKKFMSIIQSENSHYDIEDLLSKISSNLSPLQVEQNNMLMRIGDTGDYFYIILSGAVGVLVTKTISINMSQEQYVQHLKILYNNEPYLFEGTLKLHSKSSYYINLEEIKKKDENYILSGNKKPKTLDDYIAWMNGERIIDKTSMFHNEVKIMGYFKVTDLTRGNSFGEIALIEPQHRRTASIYVTQNSFFGRLSSNAYKKSMKKIQEKIKRDNIEFVFNTQLFNQLSLKLFSRSYWNYFINRKIIKGDYLFKEGHGRDEIYFIQEGEIKIKTNLNSKKIEMIFSSLIPNYKSKKRSEKDEMGKNNEIVLSYGKKGNILGMGDLLYDGRYFCDAICDSLTCTFFAIDIQIFLSIAKIFEDVLDSYNKLEENKKKIMINRLNTIKYAYQNTLLGEHEFTDGIITKSGKEIKFQDWFDADKNFVLKTTDCKRKNVFVNVDKLKEKNFMPPINKTSNPLITTSIKVEKKKSSPTVIPSINKTYNNLPLAKLNSTNFDNLASSNKNVRTMLITMSEGETLNPSLVKFCVREPTKRISFKENHKSISNKNLVNIRKKSRKDKRSKTVRLLEPNFNDDNVVDEILHNETKYVLRLVKKNNPKNKPTLITDFNYNDYNNVFPNSTKSKSGYIKDFGYLMKPQSQMGPRNLSEKKNLL